MLERAFEQQVAEILGLSTEGISPIPLAEERSFYATAFGLYERGDYEGAAQLFTQLVLTDPYSPHYWQGLASCKQMSQDYKAALHAWGVLALLREEDPLPHFHAAECLLSLEEKEEALKALDAALQFAGKNALLEEKIDLLKAIHYA